MKNLYLISFVIILLAFSMQVSAQYTPSFNQPVYITEPFGDTLNDHAALLIIDTQTPITAGDMKAGGDDIRFTKACHTQFFDYWIESGINTTQTRIWVRIPQLMPNQVDTISLAYGDMNAVATSSFAATFPNSIITNGNDSLSGEQHIGWLDVNAGDTLFVEAGTPLLIYAGYANVEGVIWAKGRGYAIVSPTAAGLGPGGGTTSTNAGSGGGSYGALGGTGGMDSGDTPGNGGPVYGTAAGSDIDMGSAGGSSDNTMGGAGGGSVTIKGAQIHVSGIINADGNDGQLPGASRGGGGGAGGGVLLMADSIHITGSIRAQGGIGSIGTSSVNDSGGGGAGGRLKIFSDAGIINNGITNTNGGAGGPNGAPPATPGGNGTVHTGTFIYPEPQFGNATPFSFVVTYDEANDTICHNISPFILTPGNPAGGTYSGNGVTGNMFDPLASGPGLHYITYTYAQAGCQASDSSHINVVVCMGIDQVNENAVRLYPNPALQHVTVSTANHSDGIFEITDITGRIVMRGLLTGSATTIALDNISPGVYVVTTQSGDASPTTSQLVVE